MAKTFLEYKNEMIDVYAIKQITKNQTFNTDSEEMEYNIVINKDYVDSSLNFPLYVFPHKTEELRDREHELLKIQLDGFDFITIL